MFGPGRGHWLPRTVTAAFARKRVSLSFEALKPGTDFSLKCESAEGIFFQYKEGWFTLLFRAADVIPHLSWIFWTARRLPLYFSCYGGGFFP